MICKIVLYIIIVYDKYLYTNVLEILALLYSDLVSYVD